jgi:hypothetical protein
MKERSANDDSTVGVLLVAAETARIGEWQPRRVEELRKLELPVTEAAEHELVGPSYSHPRGSGAKATAARSSSQRDLWERRMHEHRVRFARSAAVDAARIAKRRGWQAVLVSAIPGGEARLRAARSRPCQAVPIDVVLDWMRPPPSPSGSRRTSSRRSPDAGAVRAARPGRMV